MRRILKWLNRRFGTFDLLPEYFTAAASQMQNILWGALLPFVAWGIWFIVSNPPVWINATAIGLALFLAGYYVWRADHVRLLPKFEISEVCAQVTETNDPHNPSLFVQVITRCLTDAPVYECRGHLLRVSSRFNPEEKWELTGMNAPLFLGWDYYGISPCTLEPGIDRRLNVCFWSSANRFIIPAVEPLPSKFKSVFDSSDTFKFDVKVTAKDCASVNVSVTVNIALRKWDEPVVELIQGDSNGG